MTTSPVQELATAPQYCNRLMYVAHACAALLQWHLLLVSNGSPVGTERNGDPTSGARSRTRPMRYGTVQVEIMSGIRLRLCPASGKTTSLVSSRQRQGLIATLC